MRCQRGFGLRSAGGGGQSQAKGIPGQGHPRPKSLQAKAKHAGLAPTAQAVHTPLESTEPAMKRTYQPSKIRRARTHGFLVRMKSRGGRAVINARRAKGRKRLAV